jgi:hypothetical protein
MRSTPAAVVGAPRAPEHSDADAEQDEAAGQREEACEIVAGGAVGDGVVDGLDAGDDAEEAENERQCRAGPRPHARVRPGGDDDERELCQPARQMVGGRHARFGLEEVVVDDVEPDQAERGESDVTLRCKARQGGSSSGRERLRSCLGHGIFTSVTPDAMVRSAT